MNTVSSTVSFSHWMNHISCHSSLVAGLLPWRHPIHQRFFSVNVSHAWILEPFIPSQKPTARTWKRCHFEGKTHLQPLLFQLPNLNFPEYTSKFGAGRSKLLQKFRNFHHFYPFVPSIHPYINPGKNHGVHLPGWRNLGAPQPQDQRFLTGHTRLLGLELTTDPWRGSTHQLRLVGRER